MLEFSYSFGEDTYTANAHELGELFSFHSTDSLLFALFSNACTFSRIFLRATATVCHGVSCTFEVGSDPCIISWCFPHEFVQEVRRWKLLSAGVLYLLLTGAQSDITQEERQRREQQIQREEKREDMKNGSEGVHSCLRGSSGGCGQRKKINEASKSVISTKHSSRCEMRVKNDNWMACLSWQLKAYLFPIMTKTYWSC